MAPASTDVPVEQPPTVKPPRRLRKLARDALRMTHWLAVALALYLLTFDFGLQETHPGLQATIYSLANLAMRGFAGYLLARGTLGRLKLDGTDPMGAVIGRAIVILGALAAPR